MNLYLLLLVIVFLLTLGGGITVFWKQGDLIKHNLKRTINAVIGPTSEDATLPQSTQPPRNAIMGEYVSGPCIPLKGRCGKGTMTMKRQCISDGADGGHTCAKLSDPVEKECWTPCERSKGILDWGHPNSKVPEGPLKGWYDFTGQGIPNDYCRWVGDNGSMQWACQTDTEPYAKANPRHITFSGGPANKFNTKWDPNEVQRFCPKFGHYTKADDPDLQKSILNGFFSQCGSTCIYDYRNPRQGWLWNGSTYERIPDMSKHACGTQHENEMQEAIKQYEKYTDTRNAW